MDQEDSVTHISRHWHHWLSVLSLLAAGATLGLGSAAVVHHFPRRLPPGPLPPPPIAISGQVLPQRHSLVRYLPVPTTRATRTPASAGRSPPSSRSLNGKATPTVGATTSAGYIWNLINGGQNVGISSPAAFGILDIDGDARLQPSPTTGPPALGPAADERDRRCHRRTLPDLPLHLALGPDHHGVRDHRGRPIAVAIPVTDSFYNLFGSYRTPPLVTAQAGAFHFFHSVTGVG